MVKFQVNNLFRIKLNPLTTKVLFHKMVKNPIWQSIEKLQ